MKILFIENHKVYVNEIKDVEQLEPALYFQSQATDLDGKEIEKLLKISRIKALRKELAELEGEIELTRSR